MDNQCKHLGCSDLGAYLGFCDFHFNGGIFRSGELFDQYQVIEEDFINFIKIIPLNHDKNKEVYSPFLRDLIIRCCVQIEIFFKEWGKFEYSDELLKLYNNKNSKGVRNWGFKHYFFLKEKHLSGRFLYVRDLDINISPFEEWTKDSPPKWWGVYNSIKHNGIEAEKRPNLEMGLNAISALFLLHCSNRHSRKYLEPFVNISVSKKTSGKIQISFDRIKTPIDSKKFLFMDTYGLGKSYDLKESDDTLNRASFKGKNV